MAKQIWKPGNFEYPIPVVMVTSGDMIDSNIMTVAWTGTVNSDPAMCYISVRKSRFSYEIIKKRQEFVINLTNENLTKATDWCGIKSGEKIDKFKEMHLTKEKCESVKCPRIAESPINIECKVISSKDLGSHTMFIGKVLSVDVDDKYINEKGTFDISKCKLITYANGNYFSLGKKLGTFGFSVKKKNKNPNKKLTK